MIGIPKMKIVNMYSVGETKYLIIRCPKCGMRFGHPENRFSVECPRVGCINVDGLVNIRDRFRVADLESTCRTIIGSSNFANKWSQIKWTPQG